MARAAARALPLAGALLLAVLAVLAWPDMPRGFALAAAIAVALALGYAAGFLRGHEPLRRIAEDVERLAAGTAPRPWDEPRSRDEGRVADALARAAEELGRRGRQGELDRDRALVDGRHDALERLAAGLAGRFAEALAGIEVGLARAHRAASQGESAERLRADLEPALQALERASALVSGLRALAPAHEPAPHPAAVAETVRRAVEQRRARAERSGVTLRYEPPAQDGAVRAEPAVLGDAVGPLLDNALDAVEASGGSVTVRITTDDRQVEISVDDDGPGLDGEGRRRAFDPFYTTRSGDGLGLGLVVARAAAGRCGGTLALEPRAGGGTRAVLALPLATAAGLAQPGGARRPAAT